MTKEFTNQELRTLEKELVPFYESKKLSDGKIYKICNFQEFYKSKGLVKYHPSSKDWAIYENRLHEYVEMEDKLQQLSKLRSRTEFAKEKDLENYDKTK